MLHDVFEKLLYTYSNTSFWVQYTQYTYLGISFGTEKSPQSAGLECGVADATSGDSYCRNFASVGDSIVDVVDNIAVAGGIAGRHFRKTSGRRP